MTGALLTERIASLRGLRREYRAPEELGRAAIRYFAEAVGDANPLYTDPDFARSHGYGGVVAPPTLLCETNQYARLPAGDDGYAGHSWNLDVPGTRLVRGGNGYRFHRYARPDDIVTARWEITDLAERTNRSGAPMLIVTSAARYVGADDDPIIDNTETLIFLGSAPPQQAGGQHPAPDHSAPRRGSAGLQPHDPAGFIAPLTRTMTAASMVAYAGATWDWHRMHYDGVWCREHGLPAPVVDGQVFGALLAAQIGDHFGPDAFLESLHFRFAKLVFAGETVRCESWVMGVQNGSDGDVVSVACRVVAVGVDGGERIAVAPAGATVRLPAGGSGAI